MANTIQVPELWSQLIIESLHKRLAAGNLFNQKWAGEISQYGDTVHIQDKPVAGRLKTYTANMTLVPDPVAIGVQDLVIDQAQYMAIQIDDTEVKQSNLPNLLDRFLNEGVLSAQKTIDSYLLASYSGVAGTNIRGAATYAGATQLTVNNIRSELLALREAIRGKDAGDMINAVIPPWVTTLIDQTTTNLTLDANILNQGIRNYRFTFAGINIFESSNSPVLYTAGDGASTLDGAITADASSILLAAVTNFAASGYATITDVDGNVEIIYYSGISTKTLTGVVRGCFNTISQPHATGIAVAEITDFRYPILLSNPDLFATWAMQLNSLEIARPALGFNNVGKGLFLYGKKVTDPIAGALIYAKP